MIEPPQVLILDDEKEILVALTDLLEDEFIVHGFILPEKALEFLQSEADVAVIVSDQRMPSMTGDVFLEKAKQYTNAGAILLTGYADIDAVVAALNRGRIQFYSHKPWDPGGLKAMVRQVAEGHILASNLEIEQTLIKGVLDHLPLAILFKNRNGRFVRLNYIAACLFRRTVSECLEHKETDVLSKEWQEILAPLQARLEDKGYVQEDIFVPGNLSLDCRDRWMVVIAAELGRGWDPEHSYQVMMLRDISEQKMMEAQLRQSDKMRALGNMAGGVAHDFNNLLAAVGGALEMISSTAKFSPREQTFFDNAISVVQRGCTLTQRLLQFSRQKDAEIKKVDVIDVIVNMRELLHQSLSKHNSVYGQNVLVTSSFVGDTPMWALTDQSQLELALLNLCINARDAMPHGGTIDISVKPERVDQPLLERDISMGDYIVISVKDDGIGMSDYVKSHIFEPFFTTKDAEHGTGLGLTIVYAFLKQTGGGIVVTSCVDKGTQFDIYILRDK